LVNGSIGTIIGFEERGSNIEANISTDDGRKRNPDAVQVHVNLTPVVSSTQTSLQSSNGYSSYPPTLNSSNDSRSRRSGSVSGSISDDIGMSGDESRAPNSERENLTRRRWPVVRFENGAVRLLTPAPFEAVTATGKLEADRLQVIKFLIVTAATTAFVNYYYYFSL
jgi:hypothetical protein